VLILPAIDIRGGNCVRLVKGQLSEETIYSNDPVQMARFWKSQGAPMLHVADLDGAFQGRLVNLSQVVALRSAAQIPVQMGGGFRELKSIQAAFDQGIDKVILGTVAVDNPDLVTQAVELFKDFITVGIDVRNTFAATSGWQRTSMCRADELAVRMRDAGVKELMFTDTTRDGTLEGPDTGTIRAFLAAAKMPVLVSGGISTLEDIRNLKELEGEGLKGIVIGKALYDNKFQLEDALRLA
jgi:phosphoribosylformimino-5-aminoimidazole carboxamide ribotide isomerase